MDFSLLLFVVVVVTGLISVAYRLIAERSAVAEAESETTESNSRRLPLVVEYARALFPVVLVVFLLRSFVIEPFRIPSGSMLPSLHVGDFILVNKFSYGIRLPIINHKIISLNAPERGDVMVFRYPREPKLNFIKRVVGLPGDVITYKGKRLFINGEQIALVDDGEFFFNQLTQRGASAERYLERIDDSTHTILIDQATRGSDVQVSVPAGAYFVMGDNRDHSNDSRYWGFVPESHVLGNAFFIWFSWKSASGGGVAWSRIGDSID